MTPQTGPTSKPPLSLKDLKKATTYCQPDTVICTLVSPIGIQVQLHYDDFTLSTAFCGVGKEFVEVTNVVYAAFGVPQVVISSFIQDNCKDGNFDISGMLYLVPEEFLQINRERALAGKTTFRYIEGAVDYILKSTEYAEMLKFTPNWSDTLTLMSCLNTTSEFFEMLSEDFEVFPNTICTAKNIDYLNKFLSDIKERDQTDFLYSYPLKSFVLFENDISKRSALACAETSIIAEVSLNEEPSTVKLDSVKVKPDRFGRLRPVITSNEVTRHEYEFYTMELPTIEALAEAEYQAGDEVNIKFSGRIPILGRIVKKANRALDPIDITTCTCGSKLQRQGGQLYCLNPHCDTTLFYRILYACSKNVLDLPFDWHSIHDLVVVEGAVRDLPTLFDLSKYKLMNNFDTDTVDFILKTLRKRMIQINGEHVRSDVQNTARGKLLDALSIVGLHKRNIRRLQETLSSGEWLWSELPTVLTESAILRSYGIPRSDALQIARDAHQRALEIDTLVREF